MSCYSDVDERENWIDDEMANALDAGLFIDENDPELRAYAERGYERMCAEEDVVKYDYENQAWTRKGRYLRCAHPASMNCGCYGRLHEGELRHE